MPRSLEFFGTLTAGLHFSERLCGDRRCDRLRPMLGRLRSARGQDTLLELFLLLLIGLLLGELLLVPTLAVGLLAHGHNLIPGLTFVLRVSHHVDGATGHRLCVLRGYTRLLARQELFSGRQDLVRVARDFER